MRRGRTSALDGPVFSPKTWILDQFLDTILVYLNKNLKSQLQGTLPSGITFRGDNALWVKKSKSFIHNGEKKESHKIITKDQKGNEIIKDVPIKKKNNKFKYNI